MFTGVGSAFIAIIILYVAKIINDNPWKKLVG